jgi:hypothetical protein
MRECGQVCSIIAFLDDIKKAQAAVAVFLCYRNDESKVCAGEHPFGLLILGKDTVYHAQSFIEHLESSSVLFHQVSKLAKSPFSALKAGFFTKT